MTLTTITINEQTTDNGDTIKPLTGVVVYVGSHTGDSEEAGWTVLINVDRPLMRSGSYNRVVEEEELAILDAIHRHPELPYVRSGSADRDYSPTGEWCWSHPGTLEYRCGDQHTIQVTQRGFLDC